MNTQELILSYFASRALIVRNVLISCHVNSFINLMLITTAPYFISKGVF